jgi:hypothetical protein
MVGKLPQCAGREVPEGSEWNPSFGTRFGSMETAQKGVEMDDAAIEPDGPGNYENRKRTLARASAPDGLPHASSSP